MRLPIIAIGISLLTAATLPATAQQRGNKDLILTLRTAGNFTVFLQAVEGAGMTQQLRGGAQYTIFAPTDDAFGRLSGAHRDSLLRDPAALQALVANHVVEGRVTAEEARSGQGMSFLGGTAVRVDGSGRYVRVNGAQVIKADMLASNGIIHVVDQVWTPPLRVRVRGTTPADSAQRASSPPGN